MLSSVADIHIFRGVMVVWLAGYTTTYVISVYHHWSCEFELCSWRYVLETTLRHKVCQWLEAGQRFSPVSSTNKTDHHYITELLFKVALNTITLTPHIFMILVCNVRIIMIFSFVIFEYIFTLIMISGYALYNNAYMFQVSGVCLYSG